MKVKLLSISLITLSLLFAACSEETGDKNTKEESSAKATQTESNSSKISTEDTAEESVDTETNVSDALKLGDTKKIDDVTFTVNDVKVTDERNEFNDVKAEKVITIFTTVKSDAKEDYVAGQEADVYVNGKKSEAYPLGTDKTETISTGRTADVAQSFAVPKDAKEIEIEIKPLFSIGNDKALYKVTIE
ncbi:DUF4352 domain-containing protein [Macrococcoides canis]|uniref:DUF4352 domain-containing protein n=1 Tax=Macrococcoides canis TaxID=1855823 RepID=UPI0020B828EF|nr:DUF4352 domain-containing protein [Macrococcus canis]UTH12210.1 DUF4352 domain-containing protein [Macrococcus canis]